MLCSILITFKLILQHAFCFLFFIFCYFLHLVFLLLIRFFVLSLQIKVNEFRKKQEIRSKKLSINGYKEEKSKSKTQETGFKSYIYYVLGLRNCSVTQSNARKIIDNFT